MAALILNLAEAAELVGTTEGNVRKWVERGHLRKIPGSRPMLFHPEAVQKCAYDLMPETRHARLDAMWQQVKEAEP